MKRNIYFAIFIGILELFPFCNALYAQDSSTQTNNQSADKNIPDCDYCKEKLLTVDALRNSLPSKWLLKMEREPVFNSNILTIQAGIENQQTLLLVHGLGQNGFTDWLTVMPQLAERYHVIALDFPGFGYSSSPSGKYSPRNFARVLSWLLTRYSKGPAIVAGHSMGGAVSLRFASEYPSQLNKLILVDAAGIFERTAFVKHTANLTLNIDSAPFFIKGAFARINNWSNNAVEKITALPDPTKYISSDEFIWGHLMGDHANINAGMAMSEENFSAAIYTLEIPTQIIWGGRDPVAPLRTGIMLAHRLPKAQLHIMPDAGHTPMENPDSEEFLRLLNTALVTDPQPEIYTAGTSKGDLICKNNVGKTYSGSYRKIRIEGCTAVKLRNITAEHIIIQNSIVEMVNVQIQSKVAGLEVSNSELIATAGEISGEPAIIVDDSRVDLAGFKISSRSHAMEVKKLSYLIGSANKINSPDYTGYWQGSKQINNAFLVP